MTKVVKSKRNRSKITLPNGCWCSTPNITPKNWEVKGASTEKDWFVTYRFYDPSIVDDRDKIIPHQVMFRAGNDIKGLEERRANCRDMLKNEKQELQDGYNPAKRSFIDPDNSAADTRELSKHTPFIEALRKAHAQLTGVKGTLYDIELTIGVIETAAIALNFNDIPIEKISRKYIYQILQYLKKNRAGFTVNRSNKFRSWLMKLFKQLRQMEAVEVNIIKDIDKEKEVKKSRLIPTKAERALINDKLYRDDYNMWRFMIIFFHSGARETELLRLKGKDVNIKTQRFTTLVIKGGQHNNEPRTIKDSCIHLWEEIMEKCKPDDFVFARGLKPGKVQLSNNAIGIRWRKLVKNPIDKGGLGIAADFYSLKHVHTTELLNVKSDQEQNLFNDNDVAAFNKHTSTAMVVKIYDKEREERQHQKMKTAAVNFSE